MTDSRLISIGELSQRTGVASSALRYYERLGLLAPAGRRSGRRVYEGWAVEQIGVVRLCQDAGFTLAETRRIIRGRTGGAAWRRLAERKLAELDARIAAAEHSRELLRHGLRCPEPSLVQCEKFWLAVRNRTRPAGTQARRTSQ